MLQTVLVLCQTSLVQARVVWKYINDKNLRERISLQVNLWESTLTGLREDVAVSVSGTELWVEQMKMCPVASDSHAQR